VILYASDLGEARAFYHDLLGLPVVFEDEIVVVVGNGSRRIVLHRKDQDMMSAASCPQARSRARSRSGSPCRTRMRGKRRPAKRESKSRGWLKRRRGGASSSSRTRMDVPWLLPRCVWLDKPLSKARGHR
jgi:hypothetical protein